MKGNISETTIINKINAILVDADFKLEEGLDLLTKCKQSYVVTRLGNLGITAGASNAAKKTWSRAPKNKTIAAKKVDGRTRAAKATTTANSATAAH
jgi:hypothetical protein